MKKNKKNFFITLIEFLISVVSISSYSLWTDEGIRLHAVVFGNLKEVVHYGLADKQLFFVLKQYFWTNLVGTSEIATRSLNLVFVWMIIYYLNKILKKREIDISYGLLLFISPMYVYYMNDAGPYIILLAYSFALIYYIFFTDSFNNKKTVFMINFIFLLGVGTHFIFGFVYLMYLVKVAYVAYQKKLDFKKHFIMGLLFSPVYVALLFFYMQAIESGTSRGWDPPTLLNVLFVLYSFMGSAGLSLSRNDIRAEKFEALQWHQIALPSLLVFLMFFLLYVIVKNRKLILTPHALLLVGTVVYGLVFYLFSYQWHFHFWDRHFITAYAVFILLLIEVASKLSKKSGVTISILLLSLLFMLSSFQLRYNPYYGKDNYKEAIHYVVEADKSIILYQGDWKVSNYYGLEALEFNEYKNINKNKNSKGLRYVIDIRNISSEELDEIISNYSKDEIIVVFNEKYDLKDAVKEYEQQKSYRKQSYNTFCIFEFE